MSIESVMPSNRLILCRPLLLLPSVFPSIGVFPSESVLHIRWPKYWSFSFSISPSDEYLLSCGQLFVTPWAVAHRLLCPWDSPGKNIGVGCQFLLQGILLTQRLNLGLSHCRQILYHLGHQKVQYV